MNEKRLRLYIGGKIKSLRKAKGITQKELGKLLGVKNNTISAYERGIISTDQDVLFKLSDILSVPIDDFFPNERETTLPTRLYNYLPTTISAGTPLTDEAITQANKIPIPDEIMGKYAGRNDLFITKISGDSMDNIIKDKSLIVVEPTTLDRLKNGDIVVYSNDYEYSVKHYYKHNDTLVFKPNSTNPIHHDQTYNIDDNITIHGKVVLYIVNLD